ncbi:MAG: metalloregulator ArsR/SmtB family transcription factor [bacterium]
MDFNTEKLTLAARALSDPTRIRIIELLCKGDYCVNALTRFLKITQPAVSQHLSILKQAGLVVPQKKGYYIHYSINTDVSKTLLKELANLFQKKGGKENVQ